MIVRKFHHYEEWEDYQCGMYDELKDGRDCRINLAISLLSNPTLCERFMREVVKRWKKASEQVLTNVSVNRRAWLGWSACCLYAGVKEDETRAAWGKLSDSQRLTANKIAEKVIEDYEKRISSDIRQVTSLF